MSTPTAPLLEAQDVTFSYGRAQVLHGVSLALSAGELVGIAGPNGAGKSTLLHTMTGYLRPSSGRVLLEGRAVDKLSRRDVAARVAFVGQKSAVTFSFSVLEIVLMGRQPYAGLASFDSEQDVQIAMRSLEQVGIPQLASKYYDQLSGGEQQLVLLARALAQQAAIIILDEPVTFLDLKHQYEIMNLLRALTGRGTAVLATLHDLNVAARWCSRLALMKTGRIVACDSPDRLLEPSLLQEIYSVPLTVTSGPGNQSWVGFPQ